MGKRKEQEDFLSFKILNRSVRRKLKKAKGNEERTDEEEDTGDRRGKKMKHIREIERTDSGRQEGSIYINSAHRR